MPQIPSRLPREYESPSPDHRTRYTVVVNTVLRYSNVLHLHQRVWHKVGDSMVRTSRFTLLKIVLADNPSSPSGHSLVGHNSSSQRALLRISRSCLRLSSISSSAVFLHCASCRIFWRTASDFLEACFVKQSAI